MRDDEQIYVVDVTSGETTQLTFEGRRNASPVWVPERKSVLQGRTIPAAVFVGEDNLWRIEAATPDMETIFGMWGEVYGGELIQIGLDNFAVQFDTYFGGGPMGFLSNGYALMYPVGDSISLVFRAPITMEWIDGCDENPTSCYKWTSQVKISPDPDRTVYDIVVESQGTRFSEGGNAVESFAERKTYRFNGRQYELIATEPLDSTTQDDSVLVRRLLTEWDEVYRLSIMAAAEDRLPDVAAGEALSHQRETVKRLRDSNCLWEVTDLEPSVITSIEFVSATEALVRVTKNWDMDLICNGRRAEMPDFDGEFRTTYTVQKLPQGWRVVKKETEE